MKYRIARKCLEANSNHYYDNLVPGFISKKEKLDKQATKVKTPKQFKSAYIKYLRLHIEYQLNAEYKTYFIPYVTFPGLCTILHITNTTMKYAMQDIKFKRLSEDFTDELQSQIFYIRKSFPYNGKVYDLATEAYFSQDIINTFLFIPRPNNTPKERKQFIKAYLPFQQSLIQKLFEFIHSFNIEELSK